MKIEAVIFDWAGTTIDYGCFSPLGAFVYAFREYGLILSLQEARIPMGMLKREHIKTLLELPRIKTAFKEIYKRDFNENDVENLNALFESAIFENLKDYVVLIPKVLECVEALNARGIKIGATTGYTKEMMHVILPLAKSAGYSPLCSIASDELGYGRPYPYMMYECARRLGIYPQNRIVKVGDTTIDMQEGKNAGCFSIGVILGSSTLGLSKDEVENMPKEKLEILKQEAREKLYSAGADMVIDDLGFLENALLTLEERL